LFFYRLRVPKELEPLLPLLVPEVVPVDVAGFMIWM
jgi:hypothetical protein